jgi:hypothetical protein
MDLKLLIMVKRDLYGGQQIREPRSESRNFHQHKFFQKSTINGLLHKFEENKFFWWKFLSQLRFSHIIQHHQLLDRRNNLVQIEDFYVFRFIRVRYYYLCSFYIEHIEQMCLGTYSFLKSMKCFSEDNFENQ